MEKTDSIYRGSIEINKSNKRKQLMLLKKITHITGSLRIVTQCKAKFPLLQSIGIYLSIEANCKINFPELVFIESNLSIKPNCKISFPKLKTLNENIAISSNCIVTVPQLESVGGSLHVSSNTDFPSLKSLWGYLCACSNCKLNFPLLPVVGGDLYLNKKSDATIPLLSSVERSMYVYSDNSFPLLKNVNGDVSIGTYCNASFPELETINGFLSISPHCEINLHSLKTIKKYFSTYSDCNIPNIESIGEEIFVYGSNQFLEKQIYDVYPQGKWCITEKSSEYIIKQSPIAAQYSINNIDLSEDLFLRIKNNKITANEVFAIENTCVRNIAYKYMDKNKIKLLDYEELDKEQTNDYSMRILSFTVPNINNPLIFFEYRCLSKNYEYFGETDRKICKIAQEELAHTKIFENGKSI